MKETIHAILSHVHQLLSIASADELRNAATLYGASSHLRTALEALADEREATDKVSRRRTKPHTETSNSSSPPAKEIPTDRATLVKDLTKTLRGLNKHEIADLARLSAISLHLSAKESRSRVITRLAQAIINLPEHHRQEALTLFGARADRQTEGWVDVIAKG